MDNREAGARPPGQEADGGKGAGDLEMARQVRDFDWAATPLGPIASWPQSLQTVVQVVLDSPFPSIVLWGPELIQIYNDAYRELMGNKHPSGLGQPTRESWPEVWHINEPIYERVFMGESVSFKDALYPITRSGSLENAWFNLSYSPIRDESGQVASVLVTVFETTEQHKAREALHASLDTQRESEKRQRFLLRLSDVLRPLSDAVEVQTTVTRAARLYFQADRCYYCEIEKGDAIIRRDDSQEGLPSVVGAYPLDSLPLFKAVVDAGSPFVVRDARTSEKLDETLRQLCIQLGIISFVDVPVIKAGQPVGILCITQGTPRDWTAFECALAEEIAERTWAAVERARAEAAHRDAMDAVAHANDALERRVHERTRELSETLEQLASANIVRRELLHRLVNAQEEERGHVARELHDNTGQLITALSLGLSNLGNILPAPLPGDAAALLAGMRQIAGELGEEAHRLSASLHPTALDHQGLVAALKNYLEQWSTWSGLAVDYQSIGFEGEGADSHLPREVESAVYRVVQEALTNVLRHASPNRPEGHTRRNGKRRAAKSANRVSVLLQRTDMHLITAVEDDGPGFNVAAALSLPLDRRRLGLFSMKERAELVGGTLEVESAPGVGTRIFLRIPVAPPGSAPDPNSAQQTP